MEGNFSDSAVAVLEEDEEMSNCKYCSKPVEKKKSSCPECLKENNPQTEIVPEDFLIDYIETLDLKYFSPDHTDIDYEEESKEQPKSKTARFNKKPPRVSSSVTKSARSNSKNISAKKSMAKIKHEKQAKMIIYSLYATITIVFFGVLIWKFQSWWGFIKGLAGI